MMDLDAIKREYSKRKAKYEKLKEEVKYVLEGELKKADIPYHLLEGRVKTLDSVLKKAKRGAGDAKQQAGEVKSLQLEEIADICGVRVICLFLSDLEKIGRIIEASFQIESKDNKVQSKPQEEFGYLSVHYVGKLPPRFGGQDDIKGIRFEIQVRTITMHAWASISHHIDYKSPHAVPSELRKDFTTLSALFYLADSHFELFCQKDKETGESIEKRATTISWLLPEEVSLHTLRVYLKQCFCSRMQPYPEEISELVEELMEADYTTIGQIDADLQRCAKGFAEYERQQPPSPTMPQYSAVGAVRTSLLIISDEYGRVHKEKYRLPDSSYEEHRRFREHSK